VKRFRNAQAVTQPLPEKRREDIRNESKIHPLRKRFEKPTPEQVAEYGATLDPPFTRSQSFIAYYESNGWKVGKNTMKDWRAAVRTWHAKDAESTGNKNGRRAEKSAREFPELEIDIPSL
jgi:hypothetical protein